MPQLAQFHRENGESIGAQESTLQFCFDSPGEQKIDNIYQPNIRFRGWVASFDHSPVQITVDLPDGEQRLFQTDDARPDVKQHFAQQDRDVSEQCGFCFDLEFDDIPSEALTIQVEISNGLHSSGPLVFEATPFTSMRWSTYRQSGVESAASGEQRSDYKGVWNSVSQNEDEAKISVAGYTDENEFNRTAQLTLEVLQSTVGIEPNDVVLEIGCGVARMARVLSPICQKWIGADVSENMLQYARQRVSDLQNVEFVSLNGWDLDAVADESVDVVYCTVVFMHLDEWDRFNYICEARRVLKPGGRIYVDNFNLLSEPGWDFFMKTLLDYHPISRPPNISKSSTPQELVRYCEKAGFREVQSRSGDDTWVYAWAIK